MIVKKLESASAQLNRVAHDDTFRHAFDGIFLSIVGGVEEMVGCALKLKKKKKYKVNKIINKMGI
jgi:hypothetical protein